MNVNVSRSKSGTINIAAPDRPVINGCLLTNGVEVATTAEYDIPMVIDPAEEPPCTHARRHLYPDGKIGNSPEDDFYVKS